MANRCATRDEFLALVPEFKTYGSQSTGQLAVLLAAVTGTLTITKTLGDPLPLQETYTAGVDWTNGGTAAETAAAIAAALSGGALLQAVAIGTMVDVASVPTGACGVLSVESSSGTMVWDNPTLTGGYAAIDQALECTCSMINLECWGEKASCAHVYLAAHFIAVSLGQDNGTVKREKIDKIEVEYAVASFDGSDSSFTTTPYGRKYLMMKKTLFIGPMANRRHLVCL